VYHIFDYSIEMIRGSGILKKLVTHASSVTSTAEVATTQASFEDILPMLAIVMIGVLASVACLLAEILVSRFRSCIRRQIFRRVIPFSE
jgi:hypothetical protein